MKTQKPFESVEEIVGGANRFAVVDTETTGLSRTEDSIVEIAIINIDLDGNFMSRWDTLINPKRDVGPTYIHKITNLDVITAPTFKKVSGTIAERLDGACIVGHNVSFDIGMLTSELERTQICDFTIGAGIDTKQVFPHKLAKAYKQFGFPTEDAHSALMDAYVCSLLLLCGAHLVRKPGSPFFIRSSKRATNHTKSRSQNFHPQVETAERVHQFFHKE